MTLASTPPIVTYLENGSTLAFAVPFQFIASTDLVVTRQDAAGARTLAVLGADYSVGGGAGGTGTVTMTAAKPTGWKLEIKRHTDRTQPLDLTPGDTFPAESIEAAFSRGVAISQEIEAKTDDTAGRALLVPIGETAPPVASLAAAEGKVLAVVGGQVTAIANNTAAIAADVAAAHADRVAADADAAVAAAALASVGPYALSNVLRRLAVLEDEIRSVLPVLTTAGASYHGIYGTARLVSTYTGPAFRAIRNSDGVAVDVAFTGKTVSPGDIALLRGTGSVLRVDKWYDQSGNGRDMTQTVAGRRPGVHESAYYNGAPVILFDGGVPFIGGPGGRGFDFPAAMTGQACGMFAVTDFKASTQLQFLFAYVGSTGVGRALFHNYTANACIVHDATLRSAFKQKQFRAGMAVYGVREKAAAPLDLFINGVATAAVTTVDMLSPGPTPPVETLGPGLLGYTTAGGFTNYQPNMRITAFVEISGASPNDADCLSLTRALQTNFAMPSRYDSRIVLVGDSILEGGANTNTLELMWYLRQQTVKGLPEFFNIGISGKTMAACYADRLMFDDVLYRAGDPMVYHIQPGVNDIRGGATGAALYAALTTYVAYHKGKGTNVKSVVGTLLHDGTLGGPALAELADYNARLRAGWASIGVDALLDWDAALAAVDPSYWTNTSIIHTDLIHPVSHGYELLAPSTATSYNLVLP